MSNKNSQAVTDENAVNVKRKTGAEGTPRRTTETFDITNPEETRYLASDLAKFIQENKLFHNIQGKEYVNVEGWQYAGSRLGILPVVDELNRVRDGVDDNEVKYQAKVKLFDLRTEQIVGTGFAICSNKESSKKFYQEFAIASMAQTRAIGKAYRNILAWIIRAAGYEPTPAEEMDYVAQPTAQAEGRPVKPLHTEAPQTAANRPAQPEVAKETPAAQLEERPEDFKPVTINQKTQILLLLNNSVITKEEKEKMVSKLNTFDTVRADQAIAKLKKVIKDRATDSSSDMAA
jgi:hypothetical protein